MRALALIAVAASLAPLARAAGKLSLEDRIELTRGLTAEYANAKVLLPRSKKPLEFNAQSGAYDKKEWAAIARESGPAARTGVQVDGGMGGAPAPISNNSDVNAPGGTSIVVLFHKPLEGVKSADVKKMLAPVLDFDRHSVTEIYSETLPPAVQQAIKEKRALVGMDREQVRMALGQPTHKERESNDGVDTEDWVFGTPPGKITFVTFSGEKVIRVKEDYAGLGTDVSPVKK